VHDSFFARGGHSLLATQVVSRVKALFGIELPLRAMFDTATLAEMAQLIVTERQAGGVRTGPAIERRSRETAPALSYAQQRLWFLDQFEPQSAVYNVPAAIKLTGELDRAALAQSLSEIARRHEVLRTSFPSVNGRPVQLIAPPAPIDLPLTDLQALTEQDRKILGGRYSAEQKVTHEFTFSGLVKVGRWGDVTAQQLATEETARPFDLAHGPVWRVRLLRLSEQEHVLLLTMHHIVTDGWSIGVLLQELTTLYEVYRRAEVSPLAELPVQYADFAEWQREWLRGGVLEEQMGYWREQLAGSSGVLELPTDHPRPPVQRYRGASLTVQLSEELTSGLRELSQGEGVTLFMTLLSSWQTLLARYSGQWDLNVGTPIANRTRGEVEGLIGFFINTLVLRTQLKPEASFREQLQQVREVCLGAYAHQDVPFEMVVEVVQPERDLSRTPLFQVMFILQMAPLGEIETPAGLKLEPLAVELDTTKFDLTLGLMERDTRLVAWCNYRTDLFEEATIARMLDHWQVLLEAAVADPEQSLSALPLLTAAERAEVVTWNETSTEYARETCIHEQFERQAALTPDAVALVFEDRQLSYWELNSRANQLAHYLQSLGVGPETVVAICLERSLEMVVALLGVLKAGAAYLPLDPDYPPERLSFMLADAAVPVLLTTTHLQARLAMETAAVICLDTEWESIAAQSSENPASAVSGDNLAYVIYTSGSTGQPKGAMNTHAAIYNRLCWMQEAYGLTAADRILQKTPFSFDVSVWEFFWPLMTGACLVVARPGGHRDSAYLVELIQEEQITTLHFVPAMLQVFLAEEGVEACNSLRRVICSGEALARELQDRFFTRLPEVELHNLYGPTEAAVDVTYWACDASSPHNTVPIGRPIANTQIYLVDQHNQLAPVGVPGELCIGGVQLARGYHQRAALTAERFVPDPFSSVPGARLYRTGYLARYLSDVSI
jgi:amino acid adenylation domain-containing protein